MAGLRGDIRSFMALAPGPGRTAPSLLEDINLYDFQRPSPVGVNILRDAPLQWARGFTISTVLPTGSCLHVFCTKGSQSQLPALDSRPGRGSLYKVAAVCRKCRTHMLVIVDYTAKDGMLPCPNAEHPLHHLVHSPWRGDVARKEEKANANNAEQKAEVYAFECTSPTCPATVLVVLQPPRLSPGMVHALTDQTLLHARTEAAFKVGQGRLEGYKQPSPLEVVSDLRKYLQNAWTSRDSKTIRLDNKRFMLRFGPDGEGCKDVLEFIGFTLEPQEYWQPPKPNLDDSRPFQDKSNVFLDDIEQELGVLILQRPENERQLAQENTSLPEASRDLSRALSCQDYNRYPGARTTKMIPSLRPACFTALGIPPDASDDLVTFAYRRQVETDPANTPLYLTYLIQTTEDRSSESLQMEVAIERSAGKLDFHQLTEAYRYFGFNVDSSPSDDAHIIGTFQSRMQDAPVQEAQMREQLRIIGTHRNSTKILHIAEDAVNSYEQALAFLRAERTTEDEFISALFTAKMAEDPTDEETARKAVRVIAEARKSKVLFNWLSTGKLEEPPMDVGEAYQLLLIHDRTIDDDDLIKSQWEFTREDRPEQEEQIDRAMSIIATNRQSATLLDALRAKGVRTDSASDDWPVGLENIGNTCYLNSLLQFLFTIPKLRNLVLNFDDFRVDLSNYDMTSRRVGSRHITLQETQKAQKFVEALGKLFREMITSPQTSVTPNQELVKLTLMTSPAAEKIRRKSTIGSAGRPSLGHIDGRMVMGPLGPPTMGPSDTLGGEVVQSPTSVAEHNLLDGPALFAQPPIAEQQAVNSLPQPERSDAENGDANMAEDNSSEATLVTTPQSGDDSVMVDASLKDQPPDVAEDKENLAPARQEESLEKPPSERVDVPLRETSSSKLNVEAGATLASSGSTATAASNEGNSAPAIPPTRPPPVPPRPAPQIAAPTLEDYARQQDVTEVIDHTLFQLSCAIKPEGVDKDGNQIDQVHDLFFGKRKTHVLNSDTAQTKEEEFYGIICRLEARPHDIYAALDNAFDLSETPGGSSRYDSLSRAPPVFQVYLDRLGFDPVTKRAGKIHHYVQLKETIYLDRYLEADVESQLMDRRQQVWAWKKQLAEIQARQSDLTANESHPDAVSTFTNARQIMLNLQEIALGEDSDEIDVPSQTIATLQALAEHTKAELDSLDGKARDLFQQIETNFTDMRKHAYCLHAAFFHRGTDASGHYWVYIYDFKKEIWRRYNDGYVTEVKDTNEIFRAPSEAEMNSYSGPPNPYVLIYVRSDLKDDLVENVHREIMFPPPPPPPTQPTEFQVGTAGGDVRMTDDTEAAGTTHIEHTSSAPGWPSEPQPQSANPPAVNPDLRGADIKTKW